MPRTRRPADNKFCAIGGAAALVSTTLLQSPLPRRSATICVAESLPARSNESGWSTVVVVIDEIDRSKRAVALSRAGPPFPRISSGSHTSWPMPRPPCRAHGKMTRHGPRALERLCLFRDLPRPSLPRQFRRSSSTLRGAGKEPDEHVSDYSQLLAFWFSRLPW